MCSGKSELIFGSSKGCKKTAPFIGGDRLVERRETTSPSPVVSHYSMVSAISASDTLLVSKTHVFYGVYRANKIRSYYI